MTRRIVVTGGPGAGKTSLIAALAAQGFSTREEGGRRIIRAQVASGGRALPWIDPGLFAEAMFAFDLAAFREAEGAAGPVFFDRGIPDVVGYLTLTGRPIPPPLENAARSLHYEERVFIAPPWEAIFVQDSERAQDFAEAVQTHDAIAKTYLAYGYSLVALPRLAVGERARFLRDAAET